MGMYDSINSEQIKCFPWVSLDNNNISYHGGNLHNFKNGDKVPYKKPHYNYGKNFIILDMDRSMDKEYSTYKYIIHVIIDGKVQNTFTDKIGKINWSINTNVIDYIGNPLNIHSSQDILDYIEDYQLYFKNRDDIYKNWTIIFKEYMSYSKGIALLDTEEKKNRIAKIEECKCRLDTEKDRIQPEIDALDSKFSKWIVDTSNILDVITLGDYISAYYTEYSINDNTNSETLEYLLNRIHDLLKFDKTLYNRYVEWQDYDDINIKYFKEKIGD